MVARETVSKVIKAIYPLAAIVAVAVLEVKALDCGLNGETFLSSVCIIAGIAGYYVGKQQG